MIGSIPGSDHAPIVAVELGKDDAPHKAQGASGSDGLVAVSASPIGQKYRKGLGE